MRALIHLQSKGLIDFAERKNKKILRVCLFAVYELGEESLWEWMTLERDGSHRTKLYAKGSLFHWAQVAGRQYAPMDGTFAVKRYIDAGFLWEEGPRMVERTRQGAGKAADALLGIHLDDPLLVLDRHFPFPYGIAIPSSASFAATSPSPWEESVFFVGQPLSRSQP